jgi:hypothetical protein
MNTYSLSEQDLESLADTYDKIRDQFKLQSLSSDKDLTQDLELHLRQTILDLSEKVSREPNEKILELYTLYSKYKIFQICSNKLQSLLTKQNPDLGHLIEEILSKNDKVFIQLLKKSINFVKETQMDSKSLIQSQNDLEQVLKAAEDLEMTVVVLFKQRLKDQNRLLKEELQRVSKEKQDYITQLERENKEYLEKILKSVKQSTESTEIMSKSMDFRESRLYSPIRSRPTTPPPALHDLTLKQTKEMIEELYQNKARFDQTTFENKQPRETFENFIVVYFSQKYGLKNLCNQWLGLLAKACSRFENDVNVKIFKKIRNNEVNEEFLSVLKQLREKVQEIIKNFFRNKHPYMMERVIRVMQDEVTGNDVDEEIWNFVLSCFVGKENLIKSKLLNFAIPAKTPKKGRIVSFVNLMNVISEVVLEEYEEKISDLKTRFKNVDIETKGFISPQQFCEIFEELGIDKNVEKCVELLDPFSSNRIVFSDFIVFCLAERQGETNSPRAKSSI